jgi:hypothetical protein
MMEQPANCLEPTWPGSRFGAGPRRAISPADIGSHVAFIGSYIGARRTTDWARPAARWLGRHGSGQGSPSRPRCVLEMATKQ